MYSKPNTGASNFWILMILGCGACVFALLYNRFYDPGPLIGLGLFIVLFTWLAIRARTPRKLVAQANPGSPYLIERKGSDAAMVFWILMIGGCIACIYALLYNHFYDALPIIGLILLAGFFLFCAFATRWKERVEFRSEGVFFEHRAKLFKTRTINWPYKGAYVTVQKYTSRQKNGNYYTTVVSYGVWLKHEAEKGGIDLGTASDQVSAEGLAQFYRDLVAKCMEPAQNKQTVNSGPGRPR
jgi:hypothetical protein